jgi:hypothetical protein
VSWPHYLFVCTSCRRAGEGNKLLDAFERGAGLLVAVMLIGLGLWHLMRSRIGHDQDILAHQLGSGARLMDGRRRGTETPVVALALPTNGGAPPCAFPCPFR